MVYEIIIEAMRVRPYLYDKSSPQYTNQSWMNAGFEEIAKEVYKVWTIELSAINVQGIWKDLFSTFKKTYKQKMLKPSGSGASENNSSSCEFYDNLLVLTDHIDYRTPVSSLAKSLNSSASSKSIWQNITMKAQVSSTKKVAKLPEWHEYAQVKCKKQEHAIDVLADMSHMIKENLTKVIEAITCGQGVNEQCSNPTIQQDYFKIFYDNLEKVNMEERDDGVLAVVESIMEFMD